MSRRVNLDVDILRTFVTGFELGSFARAAARLGRSQSAISTQLRKLEQRVGQDLVQKDGRGLALTAAGESLMGYARRILDLNDEALETLRAGQVEGWVRLGLPQDFAESSLTSVLGRFARAHPRVKVEVRAERNALLQDRFVSGDLDLALVWGEAESSPRGERLADLPIRWIGRTNRTDGETFDKEPLSLVAFEQPCIFRTVGVAALDHAGIAWRLAFTSPSLSGLWSAVEAGLGVTLRTAIGVPRTLSILETGSPGLPTLPTIPLSLLHAKGARSAATARLIEILRETVAEQVDNVRR